MAEEEEVVVVEKGGKGKLIMIAVAAIVLLAAGVFAGPAVQNLIAGDADTETAEEGAEPEPVVEEKGEPLYQGIHPPLLINFTDERGKGRFLQISLELLTRDQKIIEAIKTHTPVIRNNLIIQYGDIDYRSVSTKEGKAAMLELALNEVNDILETQIGERGVEAVYFTNLVVQ